MPTLNPRITVTLTPQVHAVLRELSGLTGNSQSAIVGELLETSLPIFERITQALSAVANIEGEAKGEIKAGLERAQVKLEGQLGLALETMDEGYRPLLAEAEKVSRRGARSASRSGLTPVPVTRGSGLTPGSPKATGKGKKSGGV